MQASQSQPTPIHLRVTVSVTPTGAVVTWRAVPGATHYVVHRWRQLDNHSRCSEMRVPAPGTVLRYVDSSVPGAVAPTQGVVIPVPKPGIIVINFEDRWRKTFTDRLAFYAMVLQVERVP